MDLSVQYKFDLLGTQLKILKGLHLCILLHKSEKRASDSKQKHRNNTPENQKLQEAIKDYLENFHNLRAHARTIEFT
jgi:hypothetical protein